MNESSFLKPLANESSFNNSYLLMRHGESEANVSALLKTIIGKPLNELFNHMASKIEESISKD